MKYCGIADEAGESLDLQIKAHRELGWNGIELRNIDSQCVTDLSDEDFEESLQKLADAGIQVVGFASQIANWARPIDGDFEVDRAELERAIPRMQRCGAQFIRVMSYPNAKDNPLSEEDWRDEVVRRFQTLAAIAADGGVTLVHENCHGWGSQSPQHAVEFLDRVDSPALKIVFDTGNEHHHDTVQYFRTVRDRIAHMHIKSWKFGDDGKPHSCFPDEADSGTSEILTQLLNEDYDGWYSIEPHMVAVIHLGKSADEDPETAYKLYVEFGQRLMKLVDSLQS
jgi:sugar phosphate isomerase/epimerase